MDARVVGRYGLSPTEAAVVGGGKWGGAAGVWGGVNGFPPTSPYLPAPPGSA